MTSIARPHRAAALAVGLALVAAALAAGCVGSGGPGLFGRGGDRQQAAAGAEMTPEEAAALRKLVGPGYCPKVFTPRGGETIRVYAQDREDDPAFVVWQASLSETARECSYDGLGTLTIKIGVSGRVVVGPAGQPGTYTVPLEISVEKFKEATLASAVYPLDVTVGPQGSVVFRQVYTVDVPSPGGDRDYLVNVGFQDDEAEADTPGDDETT